MLITAQARQLERTLTGCGQGRPSVDGRVSAFGSHVEQLVTTRCYHPARAIDVPQADVAKTTLSNVVSGNLRKRPITAA